MKGVGEGTGSRVKVDHKVCTGKDPGLPTGLTVDWTFLA